MAEIVGTPIADLLFGSLGDDEIVAQAGDDSALGFDGSDVVWGNAGNDILGGNQGEDTLYGGQGNDILLSGQGDDLGSGDEGVDLIFGNRGMDSLFGNGGDDAIFGGKDTDFILGGRGNDFLAGELGNDVIFGNVGADTMSGGAGNDLFVLTKGGGGMTPEEADLILDFTPGDRIALSDGLRIPEINIQFVPYASGNGRGDVIVRDLGDSTGSFLAIFRNVEENAITLDTFTASLDPLEGDDSGGDGGGGVGDGGGGGGPIGNVPPFARDGLLNTTEDNFITGFFDATDGNDDELTFSIVNDPTLGRVTISDPSSGFFVYTPNPNISGQDTITFVANDGTVDSNVGTITVDVFPVEDVPIANAATVATNLNTSLPILLSASDGDGDPLSLRITTLPTNGQLFQTEDGTAPGAPITAVDTAVTNTEGIVIFVPDAGQAIPSTFEFVATDGKADSVPATVTVNIGGTDANALPVVDLNGGADGNNLSVAFVLGSPNPLLLADAGTTVTDTDGANISSASIRIVNIQDAGLESLDATVPPEITKAYDPASGILTLTGTAPLEAYQDVLRTLAYQNTAADPNRTSRTITVTVNDGIDNSAPAVATVNYPPEPTDDAVTFTDRNALMGTLPASVFLKNDMGAGLSIASITPVAGVTENPGGGALVTSISFDNALPNAGTSFTYTVVDVFGNTADATVTVTKTDSANADDTFDGTDGIDIYDGRRGNDIINGGRGDDLLFGDINFADNAANNRDTIDGGPGDDTLVGGTRRDDLTGGEGADIFVYQDERDGSGRFDAQQANIETAIAAGFETINDFTPGTDRIRFEAGVDNITNFANIQPIVQTAATVDNGVLAAGQHIFAYELGGSTYLIYDGDSDNLNGNDSFLLGRLDGITGLGTLSAGDFEFA
ncbi:MAG: Ig-like domain-containing protein [Cyanobacteriota bacterium]|nr:Ig-like domain-containing protein [Cyanobacteriota bacterium]